MKILSKLILIITLSVIIYGCKKTPECCSPIQMQVVKSADTAYAGIITDVKFEIKLLPDLITESYPSKLVIKEGNIIIDSINFYSKQEVTHNFDYHVTAEDVPRNVELTFYIYDDNNKFSTEYSNLVIAKYPPPSFIKSSGIFFFSTTSLNYSMMLIFKDTSCYTADAHNINGDITFIWQPEYNYTLASPDAETIATVYDDAGITYSYAGRKHSSIMEYSGEFNDITELELNEIVFTETILRRGGSGVEMLLIGDKIAFQLQDGRKGILEVLSCAKKGEKLNKSMYFNVIFQKTAYEFKQK